MELIFLCAAFQILFYLENFFFIWVLYFILLCFFVIFYLFPVDFVTKIEDFESLFVSWIAFNQFENIQNFLWIPAPFSIWRLRAATLMYIFNLLLSTKIPSGDPTLNVFWFDIWCSRCEIYPNRIDIVLLLSFGLPNCSRGGQNKIVLCETFKYNKKPTETNHR